MRTVALWLGAITLLFSTLADAATVEVTRHGSGSVTVATSDLTINCPGTCTAEVADGTILELVASPDATQAELIGWGAAAAGCENNATCYLDTSKTYLAPNGVFNAQAWSGYRQGSVCRAGRNTGITYYASFQAAINAVAAGTASSGLVDCKVQGNTTEAIDVTAAITLVAIWTEFAPRLPYGKMSTGSLETGTLTITTGSLIVGTKYNGISGGLTVK